MKLAISDFRNIRRLDLDLAGVTLVAGLNKVGKSSICRALGAALTLNAAPGGLPKASYVREGAAMGIVALEHDAGSVTIAWPVGTVATTGEPLKCSAIAAGLASLATMRPEDRARTLQEALGANPTIDDLRASIDAPEALIQAVWGNIQRDGWDAACAAAKAKGAELKGRWREVTGEQYGSAKAPAWRPQGFVEEDASLPVDELQRLAADGRKAAARAEVTAEQREAAAKALEQIDIPRLTDEAATARALLDKAMQERAAAPAVWGDAGQPCPWCRKNVRIERDAKLGAGYYKLERFEEAVSKEDHLKRTKALAALDATVQAAQKVCREVEGKLATAEADCRRHEAAVAAEPEDAAAAGMETRALAAITYRRASDLATKIAANARFVEALAPSGVRARVMGAALDRLNGAISAFVAGADEAGIEPPMVGADMLITRAGRPYEALSESEKFRVDVAIQVALAKLAGDAMVVIDGADVLDVNGLNALFGGLAAAGVPALVASKINAKRLMPDMAALGGRSYWVEG